MAARARNSRPYSTTGGHVASLLFSERTVPQLLSKLVVIARTANPARLGANEAPSDVLATDTSTQPKTAPTARTARENTKQAKLITMLRAPDGATLEEIAAALAWRPHTIRGAMAGALKKKLGLTINSEKIEGRGRVYALK